MFRLWGKEFKDNRMLRDIVICDETDALAGRYGRGVQAPCKSPVLPG